MVKKEEEKLEKATKQAGQLQVFLTISSQNLCKFLNLKPSEHEYLVYSLDHLENCIKKAVEGVDV
mgnify:CR=1 FL=1